MNSSDGNWREFIKDFNNYEKKNFDSLMNSSEISWWHLVRLSVMDEILIKKKLNRPLENNLVKRSLKGKLKNIFNLFIEISIIIFSRNKNIQSLYFFT